ncbi:hypothetical protein B0H66DRAFT_602849 [Apodospora peruviana]|uniref:Uncharacterized protein n=1 Tax=Apodospora peruviana TaxID=516989 RepID=A0AAE0I4R2_9PEZI|nr:hypothetical protein B0H66DRAFT_602849 [Apodospora peruviana]
MTSEPESEQQASTPGVSHVREKIVQPELEPEDARSDTEVASGETNSQQQAVPERKITKPGEPAYVAPIPKIGSIPPISPGIGTSQPGRPKLPPFVGSFLLGKPVDEYGDIVDDKTGQVLAHAGGDLPSIVGRHVSNRQGDILGDDGELLGYVADIEIERKGSGSAPLSPGSQPRSLFEIMGRSNASLMVDHLGNILDAGGNVVGKFHDNNNPLHRKEKEERDSREQEKAREGKRAPESRRAEQQEPPQPPPRSSSLPPQASEEQEQPRPPRRTEEERRENAQAWRKENPGESPSDIFLDVKSTTEGIQLTIRIPTVFGGQQVRPNISFS